MFAIELISGKLVEVGTLKLKHILKSQFESKEEPEYQALYILSYLVRIDGNKISVDELKELEDVDLFNYLSDCLGLQLSKSGL